MATFLKFNFLSNILGEELLWFFRHILILINFWTLGGWSILIKEKQKNELKMKLKVDNNS